MEMDKNFAEVNFMMSNAILPQPLRKFVLHPLVNTHRELF